jgi:DNA-binding NarL/FixJ family response regulator
MAEDRLPISNLAIHDDDANNSREISQKPRIYGVSAIENEVREEALRAELQGIQQVNSVIEDVLSSLKKANEKMTVCFYPITEAFPAVGGSISDVVFLGLFHYR